MKVSDRLLFWIPMLIWGSTWHAITYQIGAVPALNSVAYRFGLASLILFGLAVSRREPLRLPWRTQAWLAVAGVLQFSISYWCVYEAESVLPSGLMAVLFTTIVFTNSLAGAVLLKAPVRPLFIAWALAGVAGVALIFWPTLGSAPAGVGAIGVGMALMIAVVGVVSSSLGSVLTLIAKRRGAAPFGALAWSMAWGSLALLLTSALSGRSFEFSTEPAYLASLAYLAVAGSVIAFVFYTELAVRRGPGPASMVAIASPIAALAISTVLEGWRPDALALAGIALCVVSVYGAITANRAAS
ncbi:EamA family transporter [soil metagenome]